MLLTSVPIVLMVIFILFVCWMNGRGLEYAEKVESIMNNAIIPLVRDLVTWILQIIIFLLSMILKKTKKNNKALAVIANIMRFSAAFSFMFLLSTMGLYAYTEMVIADYEQKEKNEDISIGMGSIDENRPIRNDTEFVWEENIYVENVNQYFNGKIKKEDEKKYIIVLIQEYLEQFLESSSEYLGDDLNYNKFVKQANDYNKAFSKDYDLRVQKTLRDKERECRINADQCYKNSGNRMLIGNTENELARIEMEMQIDGWEDHYEIALVYYIKGLACAIEEENGGIYAIEIDGERKSSVIKNWEHIFENYKIIEDIQDSNTNLNGRAQILKEVCEEIDIEQYRKF